jgi:hypothetical protein
MPGDLYSFLDAPADKLTLRINGKQEDVAAENGYAKLTRRWSAGDRVELRLPMPILRVTCNDNVEANRGRVALQRGPIVYCFEGADNGGSVTDIVLSSDTMFSAQHKPDLLAGVTIIKARCPARDTEPDKIFTAVPYYSWCHRDTGPMAVWIPQN